MKISTEIASIVNRVGRERAIEFVAKAGFDAFDLSLTSLLYDDEAIDQMVPNFNDALAGDRYLTHIRHLKQVADDNGISCNQSHAPFPTHQSSVCDYLQRSIECTAEMGGKICVIHPNCRVGIQENAEMYHKLLPFAKECGVKLATENMWDWDTAENHAIPTACSTHESFLAQMEAFCDDDLVACVDIGHAELFGLNTSAEKMIRTLGRHVQALHIHDVDMHDDNHQIPFSLNVNYDPIIRALKDIGYTGYFTLECNGYLREAPDLDTFTGVCNLAKAVRRLADMFDALEG